MEGRFPARHPRREAHWGTLRRSLRARRRGGRRTFPPTEDHQSSRPSPQSRSIFTWISSSNCAKKNRTASSTEIGRGSEFLGRSGSIQPQGMRGAGRSTRFEVHSENDSTVRARPFTGPTTAGGIRVARRQHAQQRGATASTRRLAPSTHPSHGPSPFESAMQRCVLLGFRFTHRQELPRAETRPLEDRSTLHNPSSRKGTRIPAGSAILASISSTGDQRAPGGTTTTGLRSHLRNKPLGLCPWPRLAVAVKPSETSDVPITSDKGHAIVDPDRHGLTDQSKKPAPHNRRSRPHTPVIRLFLVAPPLPR